MLLGKFRSYAGYKAPENLTRFEKQLRHALHDALKTARATAAANKNGRCATRECRAHAQTIKKLHAALFMFSTAALDYRFERAMPVCPSHAQDSFSEALLTLKDEQGQIVPVPVLLESVNDALLSTDLGQKFRSWLMVAQINAFYKDRPLTEKLSLNITPADVDDPAFRDTLTTIFDILYRKGQTSLILEAVENGEWTAERAAFLLGLTYKNARLAIDDYGAKDGHHKMATLERFKDAPGLIIKLDGHTIRDFLEQADNTLVDRLNEIKAICPDSLIVAEWVNTPEEACQLRQLLSVQGHPHTICMVQSREITMSLPLFLQRIHQVSDQMSPAASPPTQRSLDFFARYAPSTPL